MRRVFRRPQFLFDLAEELSFLRDKAGPEVAENWYRSLVKTLEQLKKHPRLGRERKDLSPAGIRSWRVEGFPRWLVFYGVTPDDSLVFYRIRQGTMNLVVIKMES